MMELDLEHAETVSLALGQEFLTWLWFASETQNGLFRTADGEVFFSAGGAEGVRAGRRRRNRRRALGTPGRLPGAWPDLARRSTLTGVQGTRSPPYVMHHIYEDGMAS